MIFVLSPLLASFAVAAPDADRVKSLPRFGEPPAPQFSGFLDASAVEKGTHLHYWFSETTKPNKTASTPVVLWLNGGPGSSSVLGMLQELGPLLINQTGGLMRNPYAWTNEAHVFVLESPAGVGYSYCAESLKGGGCQNTDKSTAAAARAALQVFFKTKFPELAKNPFFITGESYAGVYVPTLAKEILDNAPEINLHGVAVGDPCTDNKYQADSMDMVWYGHKYGFLQDDQFEFLWNNCSARAPAPLSKGRWGAADVDAVAKRSTYLSTLTAPEPLSESCKLAMRQFEASSSRGFSQGWNNAWINDVSLYGPSALVTWDTPGSLNYMTAEWMNSAAVREALHVADSPNKNWPGPGSKWGYTSDYAACNGAAPPGTKSMVDFYREISPRMLHGATVYNGDTDPCVSYEGTRNAIEAVGFPEVEGGHMRPWFFDYTAASDKFLHQKPILFGPSLELYSAGPQFGGHVTTYENKLRFVTVHGSGHMVPQFRPRATARMLKAVLEGRLLSPLYLPNKNMSALTDAEYDRWLDDWTVRAKAEATA